VPKRTITLNRFEKGLDSKSSPKDLGEGFLSAATNIDVSAVGRITNLGSFNNDLDAQTNLTGIANFEPGYGLFRINIDAPPEASGAAGEYLVHTDGDGEVNIGNKTVAFNAWNGADLGSDTDNCKPVYYYADGGLRIADAHFGNTNNKQIALQRLKRTEAATPYNALSEQMDLINEGFAGPVNADFEDSDAKDCVAAASGAEDGENPSSDFLVQTLPSGTDGLWPASTYAFGVSYVYYGNQESLVSTGLTNISADGTITLTDGQFPNISVSIGEGDIKLDEIQGMRIYLRDNNNPDDEWTLLLEIDFEQGSRISLADEFDPLVSISSDTYFVTSDSKNVNADNRAYAVKQPGLDTYATINGYNTDEKEISFNGNAAYGYKTAVVANQRAFVGNVLYKDSVGEPRQMGDRIQYTPVRKYDIFPQSYYLDIGTNDGDEIVKLIEFNDKLFVFKKNKLFIINIASGSDAGWYVEGEFLNRGVEHPGAVTKSDIGIIWANKDGLFSFDEEIRKLSASIKDTDWNSAITSNVIVGFIPVKNQVVVVNNSNTATPSGYIYDLQTNSIVEIDHESVLHNDEISNFVMFDDKLCCMAQDGDTKYYNPAPAGQSNLVVDLGEIDFGMPSVEKRFYKVYITHIGGDNMQLFANYNGASPGTNDIFDSNNFSSSSALTTQEFKVTSPTDKKSISLRITDDGSNAVQSDFEIQDISINLRPMGQR
jgi:hypothetical protein